VSYAQNYEDVMLYRALKHVKQGFYIDVGANDPVVDSITKAFSERGWRGVNIEPVEACFQKLQEDRPKDINLQVVLGDCNGEVPFFEVVGTGLSTCNAILARRHAQERGFEVREVVVPQCTLNRLCDQYGIHQAHFMSVDVEGAEAAVLRGFEFKRVRPWIIVVEATVPNSQIPTHKMWEHYILTRGYHYVYFDGINRYYVSDEHSELDGAFHAPPNFWDEFETFRQHNLRSQLEAALASVYKSASWRWTAPLRWAKRMVRRVLG